MRSKKKWSGQRSLFSTDSLRGKVWPAEVRFQIVQLLAQLLIDRVEEAKPMTKEEANDA